MAQSRGCCPHEALETHLSPPLQRRTRRPKGKIHPPCLQDQTLWKPFPETLPLPIHSSLRGHLNLVSILTHQGVTPVWMSYRSMVSPSVSSEGWW